MKLNRLRKLESYGQSIWMDFIGRPMIEGGGLQKLIRNDGISGVTSNPTMLERAIAETHDYDGAIADLARRGKTPQQIYEILTVQEIQRTADLLRPTFGRTHGMDGFVSLEVSPHLADDTLRTVEEARRLWNEVDRPNLMIKVPGTKAGVPAIHLLIREGINVNITLLFGLQRYRDVVEAYIGGLEYRLSNAMSVKVPMSVASFFLSRIDVLVDPMLEKEMQVDDPDVELASSLKGQTAIALAKLAYQIYEESFSDKRFRRLAGEGAKTQRVLWASTSTKNPKYSDVRYVEPLIGPDTINTLPLETIDAYREHGRPRMTLRKNLVEARRTVESLRRLGFDPEKISDRLEREGVEKFAAAYDTLLRTIAKKASEPALKGLASQRPSEGAGAGSYVS